MLTLLVSSISWLENDVFLVAHTPSSSDGGMIPETTYHLVTRQTKPQTTMTFQKVPEPCPPFGLHRLPAFQFLLRLRDFPPNLQDVLVVTSTASVDVGLVTRSKTALTNDAPAEKVTNVFTTTAMADDSRRAQMPMSKDQTDTSPIGVCLDLSSKDKVQRPLPKEEFDSSQSPLPALMILNNEGVLSSWWIVYAESIRQGTTYPGLVAAGGHQIQQQQQAERQASPFASAGSQAAPAFGQSSFGKPSAPAISFGSAFSKPATSSFSSTSAPASTFTAMGQSQSPFGASTVTSAPSESGGSTFGQPAFGSSTPMGTSGAAFGTAGGFGNRGSVWGTPSSGTAAASGSVFGKSGFGGVNNPSFGSPSTGNAFGSNTPANRAPSTSGGFASFATKPSGFMTAASTTSADSPWGKSAQGQTFGSGMDTDTSFGTTPKKDADASKGIFGGGFTLGTTFKRDDPSVNEVSNSEGGASKSMFGDGFGSALGEAQEAAATPQSKDADMDEDDTTPSQNAQPTPAQSATTQVDKPAPPKFQFPSVPPSTGGLFGTQAQAKTTPAAVQNSQPSRSTFGKPTPITTTPDDTSKKPDQSIRPSVETSPKIKEEPQSDDDNISPLNEDEAAPPVGFGAPRTPSPAGTKASSDPVPPESTSKTSFAPGDSSTSSKSSEEAPLPPDFLMPKTKLEEFEPPSLEKAALPEAGGEDDEDNADTDAEGDEDDEGLDDEGSGIDVAQEISPSTDPAQSPKITPGSSFGAPLNKSPVGGLFSRVSQPQDGQVGRSLFGEVGKNSAPYFSPPSKSQESPRSPSPVRSMISRDPLRPDNSRSASAPDPFKAPAKRQNPLRQLAVPSRPLPSAAELRMQDRERIAAQKAKQAAEEEQDLSDREDERVREELETEVEGSKTLEPFLAHQDYIGAVDKPGIPGQIEKVYRDINSMIDTLGLNARSLTAFVKGHTEQHKQAGRSRDDLEEDDDWCLIEIGDLDAIEDELEQKLKAGQIQDVKKKSNECRGLRKGIATFRAKGGDVVKTVEARSDPEATESARNAPLRLEQATQQYELRKQLMRFQKLLVEAEESITVLRAKLASCETGDAGGRPLKKPTVEAVTNTIKKLTSIVEKKSGDIDVLETQMRHLRIPSAGLLSQSSSREGSPFTPLPSTLPNKRKLFPARSGADPLSLQNGGLSHTPSRLVNGPGTPRKSVQDITPEELQRCREKAQRRQEVNLIMKEAFMKTGPRIRSLD